ncbi:MAG TPA: fibronectin type III domain-containing protein [Nitrosopumilaceae archaeon]|nr:fibronectin type III domain-containing protein [Nitrosopumilaceae archaeon]
MFFSYAAAQAPPTIPDPPTGITATPASPTKINLLWSAPSNNGGSAIKGYKIEVKIPPGDYTVLVANTANTTTSYSHTGLTTGKAYAYRISAINSIGSSNPSTEAVARTTKTSTTQNVPSGDTSATQTAIPKVSSQPKTTTPTGLAAIAASSTSIFLSWTPPTETYGQPIAGYKIDRKLSSNVYDTLIVSTGTASTTRIVTGLKTDTKYTFVVSAVYSVGAHSNPSNEASATPTKTSVLPPTLLTKQNTVQNPASGSTSITEKPKTQKEQLAELSKKAREIIEKARADKMTETDKAKAARVAAEQYNAKVKENATAALQKKIAESKALKNETQNTSSITEKQRSEQKLKQIEEENKKLQEKIKATQKRQGN